MVLKNLPRVNVSYSNIRTKYCKCDVTLLSLTKRLFSSCPWPKFATTTTTSSTINNKSKNNNSNTKIGLAFLFFSILMPLKFLLLVAWEKNIFFLPFFTKKLIYIIPNLLHLDKECQITFIPFFPKRVKHLFWPKYKK